MPTLNPVLSALPEYPIERLNQAERALRAAGKRVFDFGTGDPLEPTPPFIRQALEGGVPASCRYPPVKGTPALRAAVAGYLQRRFGVALDPETQVLPTLGSKEAIFSLPFAFLDPRGPRDVVAFPLPGYPVYEAGTRFAGGTPHGVPLVPGNRFLIEPWTLPAEVRQRLAIVWINYPHNPSGALAPEEYLARVARFAAEEDVVVCSDECYVDMYVDEVPRSLLEFGTRNVLAFHSCSKRSGMTGYRTGFVAGDAGLVKALTKLRPNLGTAPQAFVERAAIAAWSDDAHAAERRGVFARKRALFQAFFQARGIELAGGTGGFFLWFRAPGGDDVAYAERLLTAGIILMPGSWLGPGGEGFCRLALVPDLETCQAATEAWPG
mgnify:CR=1 FL=1